MAKRSDFAQKLLDDLKLRKERLSASQNTKQSYPTIADAYAHARKTNRSSRELTTAQTTSFRIGTPQKKYGGSNRSFSTWEDSKQIVSFGRGQSSEQQVGDYMALAFTMENGGKQRRTSSSTGSTSVLGFLHQLSKKLDRHQQSTSHLSNFSQVQVKEISNGAQKLNQILRACSNGINFDRYSIEIGKELLKGAVDLEESLRMLVTLQEATEHMISPQRKSSITLLEEDEEEDELNVNIGEQRQLDRPLFSFDKSSRSHKEIERDDLKLRLAALTYPSEGTNKPSRHKRSASCGSDARTMVSSLSDQKNHSNSSKPKTEKGRIPNVIAKLMGLDDLPENAKESTKKATKRAKDAENAAPPTVRKKVSQTNKITQVQSTIASEAKRATHNASLERVMHEGKPSKKELDGMRPEIRAETGGMRTDKQQGNVNVLNHKYGSQRDIQEPYKQQKGKENGVMSLEKQGLKEDIYQAEINYKNKLHSLTQPKIQTNLGFEQPQPQKSELQEEKRQGEEREQPSAKRQSPIRKQNRCELISTGFSKSMNDESYMQTQQVHVHQMTTSRKSSTEAVDDISKSSNHLNANTKASIRRNIYRNTSPKPLMGKNSVPEQDAWKAENIKGHKRVTPRGINDVMIKREEAPENTTTQMKQQDLTLKDGKPRNDQLTGSREANRTRTSKSQDIEAKILKSNNPVVSIQLLTLVGLPENEAQQASNPSHPAENQRRDLEETHMLAEKENDQAINSGAVQDQQSQEPDFGVNEEFKSHTIESDPVKGIHEGSSDTPYPSEPEYQKRICKPRTPEPLTESEIRLKQILLRSHQFLNAAEALFKLNIPFDILHGDGHDCLNEDSSKLILDCGYEIMKRKGKKQELRVHPFFNVSITTTKLESLDELVKQLYSDFEALEFYGRNGNPEAVIEDYLPRMLENDVYNKNPDVNCMWELSWEHLTFAFLEKDDVIRDVEKFVLNGLLDEITQDLLPVEAF